MSKHGELTAEIGTRLTFEGYDVFYDHGTSSDNVGKIVSTLKRAYGKDDELSQLDVAIVEQITDNAVVLVEIEETSDRPKTFLGDIFAVLFGNYIFFRKRELKVGDGTTLIVVGISKTKHLDRNQHIQDYANEIKLSLGTRNSEIGEIIIKIYQDDKDMLANLPILIEKNVNSS